MGKGKVITQLDTLRNWDENELFEWFVANFLEIQARALAIEQAKEKERYEHAKAIDALAARKRQTANGEVDQWDALEARKRQELAQRQGQQAADAAKMAEYTAQAEKQYREAKLLLSEPPTREQLLQEREAMGRQGGYPLPGDAVAVERYQARQKAQQFVCVCDRLRAEFRPLGLAVRPAVVGEPSPIGGQPVLRVW